MLTTGGASDGAGPRERPTTAITYYIVGLVSYLAKGAQKLGWPLSPETTAAVAIPVVAVGVWWSLRRLHHRVFRKH